MESQEGGNHQPQRPAGQAREEGGMAQPLSLSPERQLTEGAGMAGKGYQAPELQGWGGLHRVAFRER